jgi:membrane-associated phospholipid phosphatase
VALLTLSASSIARSFALAQATATSDTAHTSAPRKPLFSSTDAFVAGAFVVGTFALFPVDEHFKKELQNPSTQANKFVDRTAKTLEWFGASGPYIIGGTLYATGLVVHKTEVADLGLHGLEATIVASAVTKVLKGVLGRARPDAANESGPRDFDFGAGFTQPENASFPSGHTTAAFAAASAVTSEARRHWPNKWWTSWLIAPAMYGGATMVGVSRMYHNKHWASDVALGAAVGTFAGQKVVQFNHSGPRNALDRVLLRTSVLPDGRGDVRVGLNFTTR